MKRSRTIIAAVLLGLAVFAPSFAGAAGAPSYASLPEVSLPDMLHVKDAPESIPEAEVSSDIITTERPFRRSSLRVNAQQGRCVTLGIESLGVPPSGVQTVHFRGVAGSLPLRLERLVTNDTGAASLEIGDGWIDMKSENVRIETTTRVPLVRLAKGPAADIAVYGFRSGGKLHVVLSARHALTLMYIDEVGAIGRTDCGHARLTLDPSSKGGAMIVVAGRVIVPNEVVARPPTAEAQQMPQAQVQQRSSGEQPRAFQMSVSTSRTSRDKEPLLSVSVGWTEEEPPPNVPVRGADVLEEHLQERHGID
jgi:hypothetical protein